MSNPLRIWQLICLLLVVALAAALSAVYQAVQPACSTQRTLPTVNNSDAATTLVLSPAARRAHERYSL